jgi:aspartate kinase
MRSHPGVSAKFFSALADAGVNIEMISTSEIRITTIIAEDALETAVRALHRAFELERPDSAVLGETGVEPAAAGQVATGR